MLDGNIDEQICLNGNVMVIVRLVLWAFLSGMLLFFTCF